MRNIKYLSCLIIGLFSLVPVSMATTYYVDSVAGIDSNNGTTRSSAWKTIPGMRTLAGDTFLNSAWGSVSKTNKIKPGDTINIKPGSVFSSATTNSVKVLINSSYYTQQPANEEGRITLQVDPAWPGTFGDVTFNGDGVTTTDRGLIFLDNIDYFTIQGNSNSKIRIISNDGYPYGCGLDVKGGGDTDRVMYTRVRWVQVGGSPETGVQYVGVAIQWANYLDMQDVDSSYSNRRNTSQAGEFHVGENERSCAHSTFTRISAHHNGVGTAGGNNRYDGIILHNSDNIKFIDSKAYSNPRRGWDIGAITGYSGSETVYFINCEAYDNGFSPPTSYAHYAGWGCSGNDTGGPFTYYFINCIARNNNAADGVSGYHIYSDNAHSYFYNCISDNNDYNWYFSNWDNSTVDSWHVLRNCIGYKPTTYQFRILDNPSYGWDSIVDSDYGIYVQNASEALVCVSQKTSGSPYTKEYYYYTDADWSQWKSNQKNGSGGADGNSVRNGNPNWKDYNSHDYHIASNAGSCINKAVFIDNPEETKKDREGTLRANPPEIGPYEYQETVPLCTDNDHDGYGTAGSSGCPKIGIDCNDNDASINPGASEICGDAKDNNCSGQIDEGCDATPPPPPSNLRRDETQP